MGENNNDAIQFFFSNKNKREEIKEKIISFSFSRHFCLFSHLLSKHPKHLNSPSTN